MSSVSFFPRGSALDRRRVGASSTQTAAVTIRYSSSHARAIANSNQDLPRSPVSFIQLLTGQGRRCFSTGRSACSGEITHEASHIRLDLLHPPRAWPLRQVSIDLIQIAETRKKPQVRKKQNFSDRGGARSLYRT
jgi:hypothetical protein